MRRRLLLPLLVLAVLASALFVWDLPRQEDRQREDLQARRLSHLDPALVDTLRLIQGQQQLVVARNAEGWRLLAPVDEPANESAVRGMIAAFCHAVESKLIDAQADTTALEAYGLGGLRRADHRVELMAAGHPPVIYEFGRSNPSGRGHYLRVVGTRRIRLVDNRLEALSRTSYQALRIYDLFSFDAAQVDSIALDRNGLHLQAVRDSRGLWFTREDPPRQLKRRDLYTMAYDLCEMRIQRFVVDDADDEAFSMYGFASPTLDLRFRARGHRHRLRLGDDAGEGLNFARRDEETSVLEVDSQLLESTDKSLQELLETNPVPDNYARLDSVVVSWHTGGTVTAIARGLRRQWDLRPPRGFAGPADSFQVAARNLVYGLEELESTEVVDLPDEEAASRYLKVKKIGYVLYWPDRTVRVELGWRRGEDAHWLHVVGEKRVYRIPRDLFFRLRAALLITGAIDPHS